MTKNEFLTKIYTKRRFGKRAGIEVMRDYLESLSHPEHSMRIIHIAGTNGKGSTAAALSSILESAGFSVGLFTSPHLIDFNERIKINGKDISDLDLMKYAEQVLSLEIFSESTMFDDALAMALLYFKDRACDYVILETGLGGRLDSTTGIDEVPLVSIITKIGLDHTNILGNNIYDIAREKAGILKRGTTLVLSENLPLARKGIIEIADDLDVPVIYAADYDVSTTHYALRGTFQRENMENAVAAANILSELDREFWKDRGVFLKKAIENGLTNAKWPGRMQVISDSPYIIIDGAHNPQGIQALVQSLKDMFPGEKFVGLTAVLADKDHYNMIERMSKILDKCYATEVSNPRALKASELASEYRGMGVSTEEIDEIDKAFSEASKYAKEKDMKMVVYGSLYFIGAILQISKKE